jgi:transcriptional regulator with XRE-family HTH domain
MENRHNVRKLREARMWSKIELARRAGISPLTIDRIEKGMSSRIMTRRKILVAFGLKVSQRYRVFRK